MDKWFALLRVAWVVLAWLTVHVRLTLCMCQCDAGVMAMSR